MPYGAVLPRIAEFGDVVEHVLVVSPEAGKFRAARAGDGGLEAVGLADDEIGGDAAVGPAAATEPVRVGETLRDGVIDDAHIVLKILVAPIREDGLCVIQAVAGGAPRVGEEH